MRSPASPTRQRALSRGPESERSLLRVTWLLAAHSGLDSGLPDPRPAKPLLACCQGPCQPGLTSFCKAWQAGYCSWTQGWTCSGGWGSPRPDCWEARTLGGSPERLLGCFHGSVSVSPEPRPRPPPPDRPAAPAPLPLSSRPSQRPRCLQRGVEKSHPGLVNHPGVTRSGFRPWKEMAAFFHYTVSRQGLGSSEKGRGHPASLRVGGSGLPGAAAGLLGCHVEESCCELTSPGGAVGPAWHLESVLQMSRMRSDSRLDAPVSGAGEVPRGCVQATAVVAVPGSTRELHPTETVSPWSPAPAFTPLGLGHLLWEMDVISPFLSHWKT